MDTDVIIDRIELENIYNNFEIIINDEKHSKSGNISLKDGDKVRVKTSKQQKREEAKMILHGKINIFYNNP